MTHHIEMPLNIYIVNANLFATFTLNIFYCSKTQKDKTQVKQLRQSSPITYITKYTMEHYNIELHEFIVNIYICLLLYYNMIMFLQECSILLMIYHRLNLF